MPDREPTTMTVDLDWRSVAAVMALLVALAATAAAVRQASVGVTLIVVALFVALALDPVVDRLQRGGLARGPAVLVVVVVAGAAFGLFVWFAGPQLVSQTRELGTELPRTVDSLRDVPVLGPHLVEWKVPEKVSDFLSSIPARISRTDADLGGVAEGVGFGLGAFLLGLVVAVGALVEGPRLVDTVHASVAPARRRRVDDVGRIIYSVIGRYFAGSLLIALLNGIWVSVWALIAGVPLSPVLGVWAAVTSLIPQIGGLLGAVVVIAVSLAAGLLPAVIMTVTFLAFMLLTNHVLQPTIVGRAVQLSAPVTMLAAISGFTVGGIVGALFAVPTVGAIKAVAHYVRHPDDGLPEVHEHHSRFSLHRVLARLRHDGSEPRDPGDGGPQTGAVSVPTWFTAPD